MTTKDKNHSGPENPIRVGVFNSVAAADRAMEMLLAHGFREHELSVFCSERRQQEHFEEEEPGSGVHQRGESVTSAAAGSAVGSVLGGLTAVAGLAATGGLPILVAGGMAGALTGGVVGGLTGAMTRRGMEKEPADFYDQAVASGKLLVAIEPQEPADQQRLKLADDVLKKAGAEPIPLAEG